MNVKREIHSTIVTIMGGAGDLAWRKLVPALYSLFLGGLLPEHTAILGADRKQLSANKFRMRCRDGVQRFSRDGRLKDREWKDFSSRLSYQKIDFSNIDGYNRLSSALDEIERDWDDKPSRLFYMAVPPAILGTIVQRMSKARLTRPHDRVRIVVEKPFGSDLESARLLNRLLARYFLESQIYRIDHFLGKETIQNIMAFRFANALFEPLWDRRYIDHVQITVSEAIGVEHRGEYYEQAGALRDMIQNHLLQIFSLIAMEPPTSFDADEIRNRKVDVLKAVRPIPKDEVNLYAARGQYNAGWIRGDQFPAYRDESGVGPNSNTETYAALKLFVDNWRWQDVPFYLRTGKRLPERMSVACIQFRPVPHEAFPRHAISSWRPNLLVIHIQPDEGITLRFLAQRPELTMRLSPVEMRFSYLQAFHERPPEAYMTLLLDVMCGDATLFKRADQVEAAWKVVTPVLEAWQATPPVDFPNYATGSWGPESAEVLIAQDGRRWIVPTQQRPEE
jgi:glucose-6-phosphate 1-dehydrogenase